MTARTDDRRAGDRRPGDDGQRGVYVYGIMPSDVKAKSGVTGVGDPPGKVRVVRNGDLAALVSDVRLNRPLGQAEDLYAHEQLLDSTAAEVPVLPLRFGAVLASDDAVADELLAAHHDEFSAALDELEGQAEYVVKGRYVERAILGEVLDENPQAAQLRERIRDADPDASRDERIRLGEMINDAITAKREGDTRALGEALTGQVTASMVRPATHEMDAVYAAFLVEVDKAKRFKETVDRLAKQWRDRIELRLIGPIAAYDFIGGVPET